MRELLAGLNAAGTTIFLSSHQLSEVEQLCTRVGMVDRGRLVLQDDLAALRAPTGRVMVRSPDADRAAAVLDGQVARRDGDTLVVTAPDAAALNARLVARGHPGQRDRPGAPLAGGPRAVADHGQRGPRRPGAPGRSRPGPARARRTPRMIRVELVKLARRPRNWVSLALLCGLPVLVAVFVVVTHLARRRARGRRCCRTCCPADRCTRRRRSPSCCRCSCRSRWRSSAGDSIAGEAGSGMLRYLLARPVGRTRLLAAKLVALVVYVLAAVVLVAVTAYVTGSRCSARRR